MMKISESRRTQLTLGGTALTLASLVTLAALKRMNPAAFGRWRKPLGFTAVAGGVAIAVGTVAPTSRPRATGELTPPPPQNTVKLDSFNRQEAIFSVGEATITLRCAVKQEEDAEWETADYESLFDPPGEGDQPGANWQKACEELFYDRLQQSQQLSPFAGRGDYVYAPTCTAALDLDEYWRPGLMGAIWRLIQEQPTASIEIHNSHVYHLLQSELLAQATGTDLPLHIETLPEQLFPIRAYERCHPEHELTASPDEKFYVDLIGEGVVRWQAGLGNLLNWNQYKDREEPLPILWTAEGPLYYGTGDFRVQLASDQLPKGFPTWVPSTLFDHNYVVFNGVKYNLNVDNPQILEQCKQVAKAKPGFFEGAMCWELTKTWGAKDPTPFDLGVKFTHGNLVKAIGRQPFEANDLPESVKFPVEIEGKGLLIANATECRFAYISKGEQYSARYFIPEGKTLQKVSYEQCKLTFTLEESNK